MEALKVGRSKEKPGPKPPRPSKPVKQGLLTTKRVAEKFDVCTRTITRWAEAGVIPAPTRIRGRCYWSDEVTPRADAVGVEA
jgi:hypothetical protein